MDELRIYAAKAALRLWIQVYPQEWIKATDDKSIATTLKRWFSFCLEGDLPKRSYELLAEKGPTDEFLESLGGLFQVAKLPSAYALQAADRKVADGYTYFGKTVTGIPRLQLIHRSGLKSSFQDGLQADPFLDACSQAEFSRPIRNIAEVIIPDGIEPIWA